MKPQRIETTTDAITALRELAQATTGTLFTEIADVIERNGVGAGPFAELEPMSVAVHDLAREKGWYRDPESRGEFVTRTVANLHGEVSELWEAYRNGTLDHLCDKASKMNEKGITALTCAEEEMADVLIRVLDACVFLGINIAKAVAAKHAFNATRDERHGGKLA